MSDEECGSIKHLKLQYRGGRGERRGGWGGGEQIVKISCRIGSCQKFGSSL